eukprot:TRINITY_DN3728_c1_g1_i5.p1 TRINITY_DN3728_c1_g1~~TRINITY_DN3728_c1_g1_i5.p1  ORF type:complete len:503 (+),score=159.67 TRINITY_DN3728_c1_g1_i5:1773-3281(+)
MTKSFVHTIWCPIFMFSQSKDQSTDLSDCCILVTRPIPLPQTKPTLEMKNNLILILLFITLYAATAHAAYCHGKPDPNAPANTIPIYNQPPVYNKAVPNGKLYIAGPPDDRVYLTHVYGTAYEMGKAHGQLLKDQIQKMLPEMYNHIYEQIDSSIDFLPEDVRKFVEEYGLDAALQLTVDITKKYTPGYWFDEIRGIADGAEVEYEKALHLQYLGELTKGACSMFGVWGDALGKEDNATVLQLRALDWDLQAPIKDYAAIIVYHPNDPKYPQLHAAANVGWAGWVGGLTGVSSTKLGISEIGVSFPDATFGKESRFGIPFNVILKDIILVDQTLEDSITRLNNAERTCNLILGVGDAKFGKFNGFQYGHSVMNVIGANNLLPVNDTWHQQIADTVYFGMDWLCPGFSIVLQDKLKKFHGNITVANSISNIVAQTETGDCHVAIYNMAQGEIFVANSRRNDVTTGGAKAFQRQWIRYDMNKIFAEPKPTDADIAMSMKLHGIH